MKFIVRSAAVPTAIADSVMLRAMGLPGGGVVQVGDTHVKVLPGTVTSPSNLMVPAHVLANSGLADGASADVVRRILSPAASVELDPRPGDDHGVLHALTGHALTVGDTVVIADGYVEASEPTSYRVVSMAPGPAGMVAQATRFGRPAEATPVSRAAVVAGSPTTEVRAPAVLAGLDNEVDLLIGWFSLLAGSADLATAWGLPQVAGVLIAGPNGCGKSELIETAAAAAGCKVVEVNATLVFKAEGLLDRLSAAIDQATGPTVIYLARLEAIMGDDATVTFRTHAAAVLRWFLDKVASIPRLACVLGVSSLSQIHPSIARSQLLPRSITIPPPDLERRRRLFGEALDRLPTDGHIDLDRLAATSSGFSGADVMASVVQASSVLALRGGELTTDLVLDAVRSVSPSLGAVPMGEMTSSGFDRVANLDDVKQRLTEAVIWPVRNPERFAQLGIDPPRGVLLYGPPGTGKTFVIKALAHEAGAAFFSVKGAELLDKYVGESERGVREVFARARAAAPAIIFFDEFDALAPVRGRSSSSVSDSVVAALLTELDGVSERGQVAVIGATNRRDLIDPALLRAGRFEVQIELGLPVAASRRKMLDLSDVPLADDVDLDELAERCDGLSFADMGGMLREAALAALRADDGAMTVGWDHLEASLARYQQR